MTIEERFSRLERQNWQLKMGMMAILLVGLTMFVLGATSGPRNATFDTVWAKTIRVTQENGKVGITLGSHSTIGGFIFTYGPNGKNSIQLGANDGGDGLISTYNQTEKEAVKITASNDGSGVISTYDGNGREMTRITSNKITEEGMILALTRTGKARAVWPQP